MVRSLEDVRLGIVGLGYVGLPLAVEFGKSMPVVGFDIEEGRIRQLIDGVDSTREVSSEMLTDAGGLAFSADPAALSDCNVYIVTVPTPIDGIQAPRSALARGGQPYRRRLSLRGRCRDL